MKVAGTMFFDNNKLLIDKPRKRSTYQMIGGRVEEREYHWKLLFVNVMKN